MLSIPSRVVSRNKNQKLTRLLYSGRDSSIAALSFQRLHFTRCVSPLPQQATPTQEQSHSEGTSTLNFLKDVDYQNKLQQFKQKFEKDGRSHVSLAEFVKTGKQVLGEEQEERIMQLLKLFHGSGLYLHYPDNEQLKHIVITKPQVLTQTLVKRFDKEALQQKIDSQLEELEALQEEYTLLHLKKHELDQKADRRVNNYFYGIFGYLALQMGFYAKLTWIDYGWDVVEPITYFTSFSVILGGYLYYTVLKREYTYEDLKGTFLLQRQFKEYSKADFDINRYFELQEILQNKFAKFEDDCTEFYGKHHFPDRYLGLIKRLKQAVSPLANVQVQTPVQKQ